MINGSNLLLVSSPRTKSENQTQGRAYTSDAQVVSWRTLQKTPSRIPYPVWLRWLRWQSVGLVSRRSWVQIPPGAKFSDFVPGLETSSKLLPLIISWVNYSKFERKTLVHPRLLV